MSNPAPHVGDIGTRYVLEFKDQDAEALDLTGATVAFWFQPSGALANVAVVATPDADQVTNRGKAAYVITGADGIHVAEGIMRLQGQATLSGGEVFHSSLVDVSVRGNLPLA